jgi:hypothetical protein
MIHPGPSTKQGIDLFNVRILTGFIIGDDDRWLPPFLAEREQDNVPLF